MDTINQQRRKWTELDDEQLNEAVNIYGLKWQQVANHLATRTPSQCSQRWKRIKKNIKKPNSNSSSWTKEQSNKLRKYVHEFGENWQLIAQMMKNKTSRQVREKYLNNLHPNIHQEPWTQEEDDILYENFLIHGTKWTLIKTKLPSRSERMVKNRFYNNIRYTHLKLQNHYKLINNQSNPKDEIQQYREKAILSLQPTSYESVEQTEDNLDEDLDKYFNLSDDFYKNTLDI